MVHRVGALTLVALALASVVCALPACSVDRPPSTQGVGEPLPTPPPRPRREDPVYGPDGLPRESEEQIAGLALPLGLEEIEALREERRHVYRSTVPPAKLLRYFGPRLNTLEIEHRGERVTYRDAAPQGVQGGVVKLDVTIEPSSDASARVTVYERPPPPPEGVVIPEEEIRRHFEQLHERRE